MEDLVLIANDSGSKSSMHRMNAPSDAAVIDVVRSVAKQTTVRVHRFKLNTIVSNKRKTDCNIMCDFSLLCRLNGNRCGTHRCVYVNKTQGYIPCSRVLVQTTKDVGFVLFTPQTFLALC